MNKGLLGLIIIIIVIIAVATGVLLYRSNNVKGDNNTNLGESVDNDKNLNTSSNTSVMDTANTLSNDKNSNTNSEKKILVVYYSAQNHTKTIAEKIAQNLNADTFEIVPENVYTEDDLNWTNSNSRVSREHNDESLRNVPLKNTKVNNWENYDTVLIGYPIWWGIAAWPVDNFVKDNNFDGKTVIPFCTSASSGLGQSGSLLQREAGTGNWQEGHRFSSGASDLDIKAWTDSLK